MHFQFKFKQELLFEAVMGARASDCQQKTSLYVKDVFERGYG